MRAIDTLFLSWRQLKERRLRSILTILAIAVGVTTIIALSAQMEGVREEIMRNLGKLGPETVIVTVRGTMEFTDADVSRLKSLEGVSTVMPILIMNVKVTGLEEPVTLVGISSLDLVNLLGEIRLLDGSVYLDVPAPQALIGYSVAVDEVGETRYRAGQPILVEISKRPIMMTVVGVLDTYGTFLMVQSDNSVFIPMEY
ncbi:MAG: ABC transporter permease, partial [Nitrososphaerales archaeon]